MKESLFVQSELSGEDPGSHLDQLEQLEERVRKRGLEGLKLLGIAGLNGDGERRRD